MQCLYFEGPPIVLLYHAIVKEILGPADLAKTVKNCPSAQQRLLQFHPRLLFDEQHQCAGNHECCDWNDVLFEHICHLLDSNDLVCSLIYVNFEVS